MEPESILLNFLFLVISLAGIYTITLKFMELVVGFVPISNKELVKAKVLSNFLRHIYNMFGRDTPNNMSSWERFQATDFGIKCKQYKNQSSYVVKSIEGAERIRDMIIYSSMIDYMDICRLHVALATYIGETDYGKFYSLNTRDKVATKQYSENTSNLVMCVRKAYSRKSKRW
jgi:hypothetical protein